MLCEQLHADILHVRRHPQLFRDSFDVVVQYLNYKAGEGTVETACSNVPVVLSVGQDKKSEEQPCPSDVSTRLREPVWRHHATFLKPRPVSSVFAILAQYAARPAIVRMMILCAFLERNDTRLCPRLWPSGTPQRHHVN